MISDKFILRLILEIAIEKIFSNKCVYYFSLKIHCYHFFFLLTYFLFCFKDPEPLEPWSGIRDASKHGDVCAQNDTLFRQLKGSDDCLYLNVYRPVAESKTKRVVIVWIHGGAFMVGSGNDDIYGPDYLMRKDIVLVKINYRLGVLGK